MTTTNDTATKLCSIDGCNKPLLARGWCAKHYFRNRAHGDPHKKAHYKEHHKVKKDCEWCGTTMVLSPSLAKKRKCCSLSCSSNNSARERGLRNRLTQILCACCGRLSVRSVAKTRDSGKYCSRDCAFNHKRKVSDEVSAIRRIAENIRSESPELAVAKVRQERVREESRKLRTIGRRIKQRTGSCVVCGESFIRLRLYQRYCSTICQSVAEVASQELAKTARRRVKARRRAIERGREADNIDPIKVFERDGWKCHICGSKTLKSKRGTTHPKAPELEHIISLSSGGTHTWGNVACACRECNANKGAESFGQLGLEIPA